MKYEISKDLVLPPFGSGCSCIDTINGECLRGKTVDECIDVCKKSKYCKMGMYIKSKNKPSFCLPLNSLNYLNYPIESFLVQKENSKFSSMDVKFFYDKDYYPKFESKNVLFNNSDVFLKYNDKYLDKNTLQFGAEEPRDGLKLSTKDVNDFNRLYNGSIVKFTIDNLTKILIHDFSDTKLKWTPYNAQNLQQNLFYIDCLPLEKITDSKNDSTDNLFLNFNQTFNIYLYNLDLKKFYLDVDDKNNLVITEKKPKNYLFTFENDYQINIKNTQKINTDIMNNYLENFMESEKTSKSISWFFFLIIIICFLLLFILVKNFFKNKK